VPIIKIGNFNALAAKSPQLQGLTPAAWPFFWNTWLKP
jgi:peptide/nickel transport system substrate-binding protein